MTTTARSNRRARTIAIATVLAAMMTVSACDSSEDRANKHFQSAMELVEKGDFDRALVEFRNVFKLNPNHLDAHRALAKLQFDRGNRRQAFAEYRKVAEQAPEDIEALTALTGIALDGGDWESANRYAGKLLELQPDSLTAQAFDNTLRYNDAARDRNEDARKAQLIRARELNQKAPDLINPLRIIIDDLLRNQEWNDALAEIDKALAITPDDMPLLQARLGVLGQLGDNGAVRAQLEEMVERFPANEQIRESLIALYVSLEDIDGAEKLLKADAEASTEVEPTRRYIAFLYQYRGRDQARAELERVIAAGRLNPLPFESSLARLMYDEGETDAAIARLEKISSTAERSAGVRDLETELAQLLFREGNAVGARQLVERVLSEDAGHIGAGKLKASWLIQDDKTDDAIVLLRDMLARAPRDPLILTLLAEAYQRQGNRDLSEQMLSQAVEVSNNAPAESLRYAQALIARDQKIPAEQVLIDALRRSNANEDLLAALGRLYAGMENWPQAATVINRLKQLDTPSAKAIAAGLEAQTLAGQQRGEELNALLENLADDSDVARGAQNAIFRNKLQSEGPEAALAYVDGLLAETPDDPTLRFVRAGTLIILDRKDEGVAIYRKLLEEQPKSDRVWLTLYRVELATGTPESAKAILDEALQAAPEAPTLLLAKAEQQQRDGDIEGAIATYEALYAKNTSSAIVANNLASLLADYRTDEESLKRAYEVARRLRETDVPALQDTYGWIAHRMGNTAEALPYLEGAAKGLTEDPTVQYHYAVSLAANGKDAEALEQFRKTQALLADAVNPPAYAEEIASEIARLEAAPKQ